MPSILDQSFSIRQAGEALKHPNRSELLDRPFTLREAGNTAKELFGGACCQSCGSMGGRLPIRTVVHDYDFSGEGARHDLPAGKKKTKRHMEALRSIQQRDEVFVRGSDEARQHMAKLRAMRGHAGKAAQEEYKEDAAPKKRTGRFAKGSPEAKEFMAELRARRGQKSKHIFPTGSEGDRQHMAALKAMGRPIA